MILKIVILAALVRLLLASDKPLLCAGIYGGIRFFFALILFGFVPALIAAAIVLLLATLWFLLLDRFAGTPIFWGIALLGIPLAYL